MLLEGPHSTINTINRDWIVTRDLKLNDLLEDLLFIS